MRPSKRTQSCRKSPASCTTTRGSGTTKTARKWRNLCWLVFAKKWKFWPRVWELTKKVGPLNRVISQPIVWWWLSLEAIESSTKFIEDGVRELLKARRVLCGSYAYGYYLEDDGYNKHIFESMQVLFTKIGRCWWPSNRYLCPREHSFLPGSSKLEPERSQNVPRS